MMKYFKLILYFSLFKISWWLLTGKLCQEYSCKKSENFKMGLRNWNTTILKPKIPTQCNYNSPKNVPIPFTTLPTKSIDSISRNDSKRLNYKSNQSPIFPVNRLSNSAATVYRKHSSAASRKRLRPQKSSTTIVFGLRTAKLAKFFETMYQGGKWNEVRNDSSSQFCFSVSFTPFHPARW